MKSLVRRVLRPLRPSIERILRWAITRPLPRRLLNAAYLRSSAQMASGIYNRTAKLFRGRAVRMASGTWTVAIDGRRIVVPLVGSRLWLDWDQAMSLAGHEPEVKDAYRRILLGAERPDVFVDVGANYGTHSLLFLAAGVPTLTFEPNETCYAYFREACALNGFAADLQPYALGEAPGQVELFFPPDETWLGTTDPRIVERLRRESRLTSRKVEVKRLDDYAPALAGKSVLLKIDAEGHELAILRGGSALLARTRPTVIFESLPGSDREALSGLLTGAGYRIQVLSETEAPREIAPAEFVTTDATNFIARQG